MATRTLILLPGMDGSDKLFGPLQAAAPSGTETIAIGYPAGPLSDKLAQTGDPHAFTLPRPMRGRGLDFSFSGMKTAVLTIVQREGVPTGQRLADLCASFQASVIDQLPVEVLQAAKVLRALRRPGDGVIARKSHIAYHGGAEPLAFPFADSLPQLASYARQQRARWLFFSWPEAETRPGLWYLLDTSAVVPGLTPRAVTRPHPSVLYEIGPDFGRLPAWYRNDTLFAYHKASPKLNESV